MPQPRHPFLPRHGRTIPFALIGLGSMGRGLLYQTLATPGFRCTVVTEINLPAARAFLENELRIPYRLVESERGLRDAIDAGVLALCTDGHLAARAPQTDYLCEATNTIREGLAFCETAIAEGKSLVMMNAEVDLAFGPYLLEMAELAGLGYTSADGDQPGVLKRLWDEVTFFGLRPVLVGNIKGFLDQRANPVSIVPEASKRRLDPRMCASYTDGTKMQIEQALLANALGLDADVPGLHGPRLGHVNESLKAFDLPRLLKRPTAVVDYVLGAEPNGGVFIVTHHDHPFQRFMLDYLKLGPGPFYVHYDHAHLCHLECLRAMADLENGLPLLQPRAGFRTDVFARAKSALPAGTRLDGLGGHTCYGLIENIPAGGHPGLPSLLADDVVLKVPKAIDEPILLADVEVPESRADFRAWRRALSVRPRP